MSPFARFDGIHATLDFDENSKTDLTHRYLWGLGPDELLADEQVSSTSSDGDILWTLGDQVGTIRDVGEWNGTSTEFEIANHLEYDSFGNLISETDTSVDVAFGFNGKWVESETGYTHHLNRWLDPVIGKWISEDPIGFEAGDPNITRFVGNQAITHIDPFGLDMVEGQEPPVTTGGVSQNQEQVYYSGEGFLGLKKGRIPDGLTTIVLPPFTPDYSGFTSGDFWGAVGKGGVTSGKALTNTLVRTVTAGIFDEARKCPFDC